MTHNCTSEPFKHNLTDGIKSAHAHEFTFKQPANEVDRTGETGTIKSPSAIGSCKLKSKNKWNFHPSDRMTRYISVNIRMSEFNDKKKNHYMKKK